MDLRAVRTLGELEQVCHVVGQVELQAGRIDARRAALPRIGAEAKEVARLTLEIENLPIDDAVLQIARATPVLDVCGTGVRDLLAELVQQGRGCQRVVETDAPNRLEGHGALVDDRHGGASDPAAQRGFALTETPLLDRLPRLAQRLRVVLGDRGRSQREQENGQWQPEGGPVSWRVHGNHAVRSPEGAFRFRDAF